jgi:predicted metalloprotease
MRWDRSRASDNVEDRRGDAFSNGAGGSMRLGGRSIGLGTIVIALVAMLLGVDPSVVFNLAGGLGGPPTHQQSQQTAPAPPAEDAAARFVSHVLGDTEDTWRSIFAKSGKTYEDPKLVLFSGSTQTACGLGQSASGPFYCPGDHKVYIDLDFFKELGSRFGAPGDFAQAYVIGHEVGHHVQNLLGISDQVQTERQRSNEKRANQLSVKLELQADCFAGVWANHADRTRQVLEAGDIDEGLNAATAIGDDRLQKQSSGHVVPDSFTHGSSAQRVRWFKRGIESGDPAVCNTFKSAQL